MSIEGSGITTWVVWIDKEPDELWHSLCPILDLAERTVAKEFKCDRRRRQHVATHALKRLMLSVFEDMPASRWKFDQNPKGKPFIRAYPWMHFNLSHCDGLVACALSYDVEIGIDVERVVPHAPLEVARKYLAPGEMQWLNDLAEPARSWGFFQLWTLKEAFIKATGDGLSRSLQDFAFSFNPLSVSFHNRALGDARSWRFVQHVIGYEHLLALAWLEGDVAMAVRLEEIRLGDLLARVRL